MLRDSLLAKTVVDAFSYFAMRFALGGMEIVAKGRVLGIYIEVMNSSWSISSRVGLLWGSNWRILVINRFDEGETFTVSGKE